MTKDAVPRSRLAEFARPVRREVTIDPTGVYRTVGCHLYGGGVYERETKAGIEIKASRMFSIAKDDLVINRIWAQKGSAGIVPEGLASAVVTQDFPVWALDPEKAFPRFVGWYLKTPGFWEECRKHSHGTSGRERLSSKELPKLRFPLPSLDEQRRIVARIEELAALIEEAQGLRVKAREEAGAFEKSYLDEVYESSAEEFGTTKLADACTSITDGDHLTPNYTEQGIRFIFVGNVSSGNLHFADCKYVDPVYYASLSPQRKPEQGDILYSAVGATLGIPAIVDQDEDFCFQRHVAIIKPDRNRLDSTYLWHSLRSNRIHQLAWAKTTGSAQPTVPLRAIRDFPIPVPPLSEQRQVVAYLDGLQAQVDELAALQAATQAELDALLPSALDRAFKGEL